MTKTVFLPYRFTRDAIYQFTGAVVGANGYPVDSDINLDFKNLGYIDGSGLTVLCNTVEWLHSHGVRLAISNHSPDTASIKYLDDCGFFEHLTGKTLRPHARLRQTTLPFARVEHAEAHGWLEANFTPWLSGILAVRPGAVGSVRTCMKEIFNNILDHSTQSIGFVHCQHYPKPKLVGVTVSDFGKGIPRNIRTLSPNLTDAEAILKATEEGFTTKSNPRNMGVGLDFLIENVIGNGGNVSIYSYMGSVHCYRDDNGEAIREPRTGNGYYPGTLVDITLRTDCFVGDDEEEEEEIEW